MDRFGIIIERQDQLEALIKEWGFLPFFKNGIPGFSIEEMTPPELLFGNHPKRAAFYMTFLLVNFAVKNAMFNLNENNRFVMAQHPSDMRIGVNGMCGQVRAVGLDPTNGDVYIFVGMSRKIMKLLHWERGGFAMYYKRLEQGRFHPRIFLRQGIGFRSMRWDELVLLMEGISPKVARRHRYEIEEKTASEEENNRQNIWLSR